MHARYERSRSLLVHVYSYFSIKARREEEFGITMQNVQAIIALREITAWLEMLIQDVDDAMLGYPRSGDPEETQDLGKPGLGSDDIPF